MVILINILYFIAIALYSPVILWRMATQNRYRHGWPQRLGRCSRRHPGKKCIWLHAVSVGEVNATKTVIDALGQKFPAYEIILSSTTDTGYARACALYEKQHTVFYFPFDLSWVMRRAINNLKPSLILLMELEVWPNLTNIARSQNIPVVVINGRLSDKSFPKYLKFRRIVAPIFQRLSLSLVQTQEYADRFIALGCPPDKVVVTSSLKYDTAQTEGVVPGAERIKEQLHLESEPLWVLGGTGPDEEKIGLDVFVRLRTEKPLATLRLAVVPRKPERFNEVAGLIEKMGLDYVRYSTLKADNSCAAGKPPVVLVDTMGDLRKFYSLASVVFVGRSLVPMGGSDMMEPAAMGKCTTFGRHTFNFKQTVDELLAANGAIEVHDSEELYDITRKCLTNKDFATAIGSVGQKTIRQNQGATQKTIAALAGLLPCSN